MTALTDLLTHEEVRLFLKAIAILVTSWFATYAANFLIVRVIFKEREGTIFESKRALTLRALLRSVVKYTVFFIAFLMILDLYKVPTTSILASAGVLGLAVGFGAQSLIKDIISGFFIIFENQYSVGEYIKTGNLEGIVEEIGLRATKIRDFNGGLHFIPNGMIDILTNFSRGKMRAMVDVGIAYEEDIDKAIAVISEACADLASQMEVIVEGPTVLGVSKLAESEVTIRVLAYAKPMEQWNVERAMLKTIKERLDKNGIEIPYPRRVMFSYPLNPKEEAGQKANGSI